MVGMCLSFFVQYRTPRSHFEDKLSSVYLSNTVMLFGSAHKDRLDQNKTKQKRRSCVVYRDTFPTYTRKTSTACGKKSHARNDVKIEDGAGVNLPIGTGKFKTRKINADKAKEVYMHNSWGAFTYRSGPNYYYTILYYTILYCS